MFHECRPCANVTQALHLIAIRARVSTTTLDQTLSRIEIPCTLDENPHVQTSRQLGRGVHNFGHKSPLGWGIRYFGRKKPCVQTCHANLAGESTTLDENRSTKT